VFEETLLIYLEQYQVDGVHHFATFDVFNVLFAAQQQKQEQQKKTKGKEKPGCWQSFCNSLPCPSTFLTLS
jgi:hypothetical protein